MLYASKGASQHNFDTEQLIQLQSSVIKKGPNTLQIFAIHGPGGYTLQRPSILHTDCALAVLNDCAIYTRIYTVRPSDTVKSSHVFIGTFDWT